MKMLEPVIILAAGEFPTTTVPRRMLDTAGTVVCLDSAADAYVKYKNALPDIVVGDGDSISPNLRERLAQRFVLDTEQDTNDLCKAVRYLATRGVKEAIVLGATGLREDHTLGNIFHLPDLSRLMRLTMVTNYGTFYTPMVVECDGLDSLTASSLTRHFEMQVGEGRAVSVFNINATELQSSGLQWSIYPFNALWQGTLNRTSSSVFTIQGNGDFIVYLPHKLQG